MNKFFGSVATASLVLLASAAIAGPGHNSALGKPGEAKNVTRTVEITMTDQMRFTPDSLRVKRGETVRFIVHNKGQIKHEMVLGSDKELREHAIAMQKNPTMEHDDANAVTVEPGRSGELIWQFARAGNFNFGCLVPGHFEAGMVGKLVIQ